MVLPAFCIFTQSRIVFGLFHESTVNCLGLKKKNYISIDVF